MYKSLVSVDTFLAQGLHLKSHQRCSAEIRTWLSTIYFWQNSVCNTGSLLSINDKKNMFDSVLFVYFQYLL